MGDKKNWDLFAEKKVNEIPKKKIAVKPFNDHPKHKLAKLEGKAAKPMGTTKKTIKKTVGKKKK